MEAVDTLEYKGHTIEICPDEEPQDPREWDNLTEWHCWHKSISIGDENYEVGSERDINTVLREAKRNRDIVLPLYIYQHSGIALSLTSFKGRLPGYHYEFDSGQVGFVIIRRKKILAEYGGQKLSSKKVAQAMRVAEGEVKTWNQYSCGDVYGYRVLDSDNEVVESCWGFYGEDNGTDNVMNEGKAVVDHLTKKETQPV